MYNKFSAIVSRLAVRSSAVYVSFNKLLNNSAHVSVSNVLHHINGTWQLVTYRWSKLSTAAQAVHSRALWQHCLPTVCFPFMTIQGGFPAAEALLQSESFQQGAVVGPKLLQQTCH